MLTSVVEHCQGPASAQLQHKQEQIQKRHLSLHTREQQLTPSCKQPHLRYHVQLRRRPPSAKFSTFGIWDKVTVVYTVNQTVGLRSPDRSRRPPDREFTTL